jgi:hypothetical protein
LPVSATTPSSTPVIPTAIEAARRTTQTRELLREAAQATPETSTPARARQIEVASSTTPTRMLALLRAKTMFTPEKTAPFTDITGTPETGPAIAGMAGRTSTARNQSCKTSSVLAHKVRSEPRTSTPRAVPLALAWAAAAAVNRTLDPRSSRTDVI